MSSSACRIIPPLTSTRSCRRVDRRPQRRLTRRRHDGAGRTVTFFTGFGRVLHR
jgi:hypothetical protein